MVRILLLIIRFFCRVIRDIDGLFSTLSRLLFLKKYHIEGSCKKRGVCCKGLAIHFSDSFWRYPLLKDIGKWWYTFVYNFQHLYEVENEQVMIFKCNYLTSDNKCSIHFRRPFICRNYPMVRYFSKPSFLPGCGYRLKEKETT